MSSFLRLLQRGLLAAALAAGGAHATRADPPAKEPPPSTTGGQGALASEGATTVTAALQGQDGVRIQTLCTHCNSANIQVGGLSQELVPITRNGFPIVGGLATSFVLSVLPADSIAEAQVIRGPGDARLPNGAAGGEIELTSASAGELPWLEHTFEAGSFGLARNLTRISGTPVSWASGSFVFGHTEVDRVDDDDDGFNDVPSVDRDFAEGRLTLSPAEDHTFSLGASFIDEENLEGRGGFDAFRSVTEGRDSWTREDATFDRHEFRVGWQFDLDGGGAVEVRLQDATRKQRQTSQLTTLDGLFPGASDFEQRFRITETNRWAGLRYRRPLGLRFTLDTGGELSSSDVDAINREPGESAPERALETADLTSVYADVGWAPSSAWDLQLGLRRDEVDLLTRVVPLIPNASGSAAESVSRRTFSETSPRLTMRFYPARGLTLRLIAGRTFRPAKPILSQVCCGQRYQTTEKTVPERGDTLGLEAAFVPNSRLRASAYIARTDFHDHLLRVVGASTLFIQTYALANIPDARAERAEANVRWSPLPRLTLEGSASWLSFENRGDPMVDVFVSPPSFGAPVNRPIRIDRLPYLPSRSAALAARMTLPGNRVVSAQASYTGSMAIQQFERTALNSELDTLTLRRTPGFWLANLTATLPLSRQLELTATIDNLTDRLQDDLGDPTTDYNWGPLAGRSARIGLKFHPRAMNGMWRSFVFGLLLVLPAGPPPCAAEPATAGGFLKKPLEAFAKARETKRPVLLEFHATWCGSCELMQRTTWRDERVVELLRNFVSLSVDGERNRNLQARYSVEAYPTIVIADPGGRAVLKLLGFQDATALAGHLDEVLRDWERLGALADRAETNRPDPEAWLELADFAHGRGALDQAETLYRRTLGRRRALAPEFALRARIGLGIVLAETDRCREALRLVRGTADETEAIRERCAP